jgi:hypothetical protein
MRMRSTLLLDPMFISDMQEVSIITSVRLAMLDFVGRVGER